MGEDETDESELEIVEEDEIDIEAVAEEGRLPKSPSGMTQVWKCAAS